MDGLDGRGNKGSSGHFELEEKRRSRGGRRPGREERREEGRRKGHHGAPASLFLSCTRSPQPPWTRPSASHRAACSTPFRTRRSSALFVHVSLLPLSPPALLSLPSCPSFFHGVLTKWRKQKGHLTMIFPRRRPLTPTACSRARCVKRGEDRL